MKFCDKCGNLMIAERKGGRLRFICRKCGHTSRGGRITSTKISEKLGVGEEKIPVLTEKDAFEQYPKTRIICPECENNEAYWFMQQTRSGDEPPTRFYKCTRCGHSWREY